MLNLITSIISRFIVFTKYLIFFRRMMVLMIKGVTEIFRNDIKAIRENPVVKFVLIVIIFIPSLYALLNIQATWDPYARTSNILY